MSCYVANGEVTKPPEEPQAESVQSLLRAAAAFLATVTLTVLAASALVTGDLPLAGL